MILSIPHASSSNTQSVAAVERQSLLQIPPSFYLTGNRKSRSGCCALTYVQTDMSIFFQPINSANSGQPFYTGMRVNRQQGIRCTLLSFSYACDLSVPNMSKRFSFRIDTHNMAWLPNKRSQEPDECTLLRRRIALIAHPLETMMEGICSCVDP